MIGQPGARQQSAKGHFVWIANAQNQAPVGEKDEYVARAMANIAT
jgi:hypothetical protein